MKKRIVRETIAHPFKRNIVEHKKSTLSSHHRECKKGLATTLAVAVIQRGAHFGSMFPFINLLIVAYL
ncbi:hypothetical protein CON62_23855 [Bacillus toyonensis]|nr:hypothetical protein CON62_23855 [Bacillus toyonensis]